MGLTSIAGVTNPASNAFLHDLAQSATRFTAAGTWWLMSAAFCIGLLCLIAHGYRYARRERETGESSWVLPAALLGGALLVRLLAPSWTHYTFNDEYDYLRAAAALQETGLFSFAAQPPLLLYLYALAFEVLPLSAHTTFLLTIVAGSLTVPMLWGCLRSLRVDASIATLAAILLALHPLHIKHSAASSLEVVSVLLVVATLGTFARWIRTGGALEVTTLAVCLFGALTTRVENFVLLPILIGVAFLLPNRHRPKPAEMAGIAVAVVLAALYLPGAFLFHEAQDSWWKSELPPLSLLANNLAFWIGGSLEVGKLAFVLIVAGVLLSSRVARPAGLTWLAVLFGYSIVYVLHGANLGYHVESMHSAYFAERAVGHDMFRFNLPLVPAVAFFVAISLVVCTRWFRKGLQRIRPNASIFEASLLVVLLGLAFLFSTGEYRAYDVRGFLASPYNRPIETREYHFLEDSFAGVEGPALCFVLGSSTHPFLGRGIEVRMLGEPSEVEFRDQRTFLYTNSLELAKPEQRRTFDRLTGAFDLIPFASQQEGSLEFRVFRIRPRIPSGRLPTP